MTEVALPRSCPVVGNCGLRKGVIKIRSSQKPFVFLMLPYTRHFDPVETVFMKVVEGGQFAHERYSPKKMKNKKVEALSARMERFVGGGYCKVCQLCWFSDFGIAELGDANPNVLVEVGLMWGFGKEVIFTLDTSRTKIGDLPFDLRSYMNVTYNDVSRLGRNLESKVQFVLKTL